MFTKDTLFQIKLEDYSCPRYFSASKSYYGSMDEIIAVLIRLEDNPMTCTRYKETLDAAEYYDLDNELTHTVAGQTFPIFTPVDVVSRFETTLTDQNWSYVAYNQTVYPCFASRIDLRQTLIRTAYGYERCVQANISNLQVCHHGIGWVMPNRTIKGFPGMVTWDGTTHSMALAVSQTHYEFDELDTAMVDMLDVTSIDLARLVEDILAEG